MTERDKEIVELLKQGKSYTYIQKLLQVSPSTIAQVKKDNTELNSETTNNLSFTTIPLPTTTPVNSGATGTTCATGANYLESQINLINNLKNNLKMETNEIFEDDDIEVIRLKMAHDIAMKNLEKENEELSLRKRELRIKEQVAFSEQKKTEKHGKTLIFRFRKLAGKTVDGEWTYEEINKCCEKASDLKEEIEQYCFENDIETDDLTILTTLEKIISELESLQDFDADDDDSIEIEFEEDILEMVEQAKELDFDSYE